MSSSSKVGGLKPPSPPGSAVPDRVATGQEMVTEIIFSGLGKNQGKVVFQREVNFK